MADTARTKEEEREFFDNPDKLDNKITRLAQMIKKSKHFTVFTGAGVSTSAGIPDFRSGLDTVLDTGVGAWAKKAAIMKGIDVTPKKKLNTKSMLNAIPTLTHMALIELHKKGILKHLISQNCDGLHRRSGFPPKALSELHGNTNLEFCKKCGKQYLRDFRVRKKKNSVHDHRTKRRCTVKGCGGRLYDTIINFGENLNDYTWDPAEENANKSDCCLVIGSSLTVTPAASLPESVGQKKNATFSIINLQKTDMDNLCDVRIYSKCDDAMKILMNKLGLDIASWRLLRYVNININYKKNIISVFGIDSDGTQYNILSLLKLIVKDDTIYEKQGKCMDGAVFKINKNVDLKNNEIGLEFGFMKRYSEPNLLIDLGKYAKDNKNQNKNSFILILSYDPENGKWDVSKFGNNDDDSKENKDNDDNDNDDNDDEVKVDNDDENDGSLEWEDIYIGNLHKYVHKGKNKHFWTMFVSSSNDKLIPPKSVKSVNYGLPHTLDPNDISIDKAPFFLEKKSSHIYDIDVCIVFKEEYNRPNIECEWELCFTHSVALSKIDNDNHGDQLKDNNDTDKKDDDWFNNFCDLKI